MDAFQLLEFHRQFSFLDFVAGEAAEASRETEAAAQGDEPFGGIILVPHIRIPIVHRKLMMEVVIALAKRQKSREKVVPGGVLVVVRRMSEIMCKRVDTEDALARSKFRSARCIS